MSAFTLPSRRVVACVRALLVPCVVAAFAVVGRAQDRLWTALGDRSYAEYGATVSLLGDVNGDGRPDVAGVMWNSQVVRLLDGANGATILDQPGRTWYRRFADVDGDGVEDLFAIDPPPNHVRSGTTLANLYAFSETGGTADVGDRNGDGVDDFVADYVPGLPTLGELRLRSGKDGSLLLTSAPVGRSAAFGYNAVPIGDWNGDGVGDVAVADLAPPAGIGPIVIVSLKDGSLLASGGPSSGAAITHDCDLGAIGDLDHDGFEDLVVSNQFENSARGSVWIVSGATLATMGRLDGAAADQLHLAATYGDVDGDGVRDFALAHGAYTSTPIELYSGRTLRRLYRIQPEYDDTLTTCPSADLDGDGLCDMIVGRRYSAGVAGTYKAGSVTVERGRTAFLSADPFQKLRPKFSGGALGAAERTFHFHLADFQPGTLVTLVHVETDGAPLVPTIVIGARKADVHGEVEFGAAFDPTSVWASTFGLQATGTDSSGRSVTTAVERCGYH